MSLIARIQYVNFLTYSKPDSESRKPAMRVVEFSPLKYSTAINIPNGHGKTNMITALLYLLSRDRKLREDALPLFTPRRCGAPSHIRVQLWDLQDDLSQADLDLDQGLIDPRDLPYNKDHHVFGLCAYQGEEPRFYYYTGILEHCEVFDRTDTGYLYYKEAEVQQGVKKAQGKWGVSMEEWRSLITSHIPSRVLAQQVKFHVAGGGDKSAQLHKIEAEDDDESFGQAFFRTVIAPELLAPTGEAENDPNDPRENFEDLLYAHFSAMASATIKAEQERKIISEQEGAVKELGALVAAGEKAQQGLGEYQTLISNVARDGAVVSHLVQTDPFPGLLDGRNLPVGKAGEIVPYIVIDKVFGSMILDAGLEKLTNVEPRVLNQVADRNHLLKHEIDNSQVVDLLCDLKIIGATGWGGARTTRKAYSLDTALRLIPLLREIGTARLAGVPDTLQQAFAWVDSVGDTNAYRKEVRKLAAEIERLEKDIKVRTTAIEQWEAEARSLSDRISKYDLAKGAYDDLVTSGHFTAAELEVPAALVEKVTRELQEADRALGDHENRVGRLDKVFRDHLSFCRSNPGITAHARINDLTNRVETANEVLRSAEKQFADSRTEQERLETDKTKQETQHHDDQRQFDALTELQSHEAKYTEWFGDTQPQEVDISGGLAQIARAEKALEQQRQKAVGLRDTIADLLPAIPRFHELFEDVDATGIDIHRELQEITKAEQTLARERNLTETLHQRILKLKPMVQTFRDVFDDADPAKLDPMRDRLTLEQSITLAGASIARLEGQTARLAIFRKECPGWTAIEWLAEMEKQRASLAGVISQCGQEIQTATRQLRELMSDPVARPEDVASAHALLDGSVDYLPLHNFIEEHCPAEVRKHWLTHFSALLFSPVVDTLEEAAQAAHLLYDGQKMMPVLIADRLTAAIQSETPALAFDGDCAYTWLAGIKTRMVHCILNPAAVEEERLLAQQRVEQWGQKRDSAQEELDSLSEESNAVILARDAAQAEKDNAEVALTEAAAALEELRIREPEVIKRSAPEALDAITKMKEFLTILVEHGNDVFEQTQEALRKIEQQEAKLRESRSWYEERNTDEVRNIIDAMRRYQALLSKHGTDVYERTQAELAHIAEQADDLKRSREWHEARNSDDVRRAIDAMRKFAEAGGTEALERFRSAVKAGATALESIRGALATASNAVTDAETRLREARVAASNASSACDQNQKHLKELADFAASDDLQFMEDHEAQRQILATNKGQASTRKGYESQFVHAQRYVTDRGSDVSEQELLNQKANFEAKAADAKAMQTRDGNLVEEARGRQTSLIQFRDALHETAARILTEFRAVSRSLEEIGEAMAATSTRFENTDLYQLAETIRNRLDKADGDPFVMSDIRKIGSLAVGLGLAAQSKDIARVKKESNQLATRYREQKTALCSNVISGTQKGLSPFNAEWLQGQDRFDAPAEMKSQIESSIEEKRSLLTKATVTLEDVRDKTTKILSTIAKDSDQALAILEEAMGTTPEARFYVNADVISEDRVNILMHRLYADIESKRRAYSSAEQPSAAAQRRQKKNDLEHLRDEIYRSLFTNVKVEFRHPSIWEGKRHALASKGLSEGMRTAISLMWISKLAEFRLRQAIDQSGGMKRQNRAALRKERFFMILDGLFSNLSHDDMIDSAMESLALSAGHFQLIGMIHHPRYINNPKIFRSYFVGREFRAVNGKHSWLAVDSQKDVPASLGVFGSHFTPKDNHDDGR